MRTHHKHMFIIITISIFKLKNQYSMDTNTQNKDFLYARWSCRVKVRFGRRKASILGDGRRLNSLETSLSGLVIIVILIFTFLFHFIILSIHDISQFIRAYCRVQFTVCDLKVGKIIIKEELQLCMFPYNIPNGKESNLMWLN